MAKEDAYVSSLDVLFEAARADQNIRRYGIPNTTERTRTAWKYGSSGQKTSQV